MKALVWVLLIALTVSVGAFRATGQDVATEKKALTNQDVVSMVKAGLAPEIVIATMKSTPCKFDVSPQGLTDLKASGVPDPVILEMVNISGGKTEPKAVDSPKSDVGDSKFGYLKVYRARRFTGSGLAPSIYVDEKQIVRVGNGRRCTIKLTPGEHKINSDDKSSAISLDVKAGAEYYIRVDEEPGFWKGHGKLTMLPTEQGTAEYKMQKPVEEDRIIDRELVVVETAEPETSKKQ